MLGIYFCFKHERCKPVVGSQTNIAAFYWLKRVFNLHEVNIIRLKQ